jgi:hypothetical protein
MAPRTDPIPSEMSGKSRGLGIFGWLLVISVALLALLILIVVFYEGRIAYWDSEIRKMCMKDGGMKIFETAELKKQQYVLLLDKFGQLDIPTENRATEDVPIFHKATRTFIHRNNPEVWRYELEVIRKNDKRVLGKRVTYWRVGGDLIALHPSQFSCPEKSEDIFSALVHQSGEKK